MHHRSTRGVATTIGTRHDGPRRLPTWATRASPLAIAIAAVLYPASMIFAQNQDPQASQLEEIIVTATRRSVDLQRVPQSVTALSTDFIEKQALTNLYDLAGALPSLNIVSTWPGQNTIVIRGISTGSAEYRVDSQVSIYLDDQPMTSVFRRFVTFCTSRKKVKLPFL